MTAPPVLESRTSRTARCSPRPVPRAVSQPGRKWGLRVALVTLEGVSCATASRCVAVDNNGDVLTPTDPTGGAGSWHFENLVPFQPTENEKGLEPSRNALFSASCASATLCGLDGRIFTATDPFSAPARPLTAAATRLFGPPHGPRLRRTLLGSSPSPANAASVPAFASTRRPRPGASNASATAVPTAPAAHRCATGQGTGDICCACAPSVRPDFMARRRSSASAC